MNFPTEGAPFNGERGSGVSRRKKDLELPFRAPAQVAPFKGGGKTALNAFRLGKRRTDHDQVRRYPLRTIKL